MAYIALVLFCLLVIMRDILKKKKLSLLLTIFSSKSRYTVYTSYLKSLLQHAGTEERRRDQ